MSILRYQGLEVGTSKVDLAYGHKVWRAEVRTIDDAPIPVGASVQLVIDDSVFVGTVVRAAPFTGRGAFVVAGGGGGWRINVHPTALRSDGGIRLATALQVLQGDVATAAGKSAGKANAETVQLDGADRTLGKAWAPIVSSGSDLLSLFGEAWFVDAAGTTRVGYTSTVALASDAYAVEDVDEHGDAILLGVRDAAGLAALIGAIKGTISGDQIPGTFQIKAMAIREMPDLRVEVYR